MDINEKHMHIYICYMYIYESINLPLYLHFFHISFTSPYPSFPNITEPTFDPKLSPSPSSASWELGEGRGLPLSSHEHSRIAATFLGKLGKICYGLCFKIALEAFFGQKAGRQSEWKYVKV